MKQHDVILAELSTAAPQAWYLYNDWPMHCNKRFATPYVSNTGIMIWECSNCGEVINNADLPSASDDYATE